MLLMSRAVVLLDNLRIQLHLRCLSVTANDQETVLILISHIGNTNIETEILLIYSLKIVLAYVVTAHRDVFKFHTLLIFILDFEFGLRLRAAADYPAI